jgi:uncharacterized protein
MIRHSARIFWFGLGSIALTLGALGVILPLLPTTPFVLVAAFAFARSSPRIHKWLLRNRAFGPLINDWRKYGAIGRRAKAASVSSLLLVLIFSLLLGAPFHAVLIQLVVLPLCALFILTRPRPPIDDG